MRVLFIGGTGNISAECARRAYEMGHEVMVLTRGKIEVPAAYTAIRGERHDAASMRAAADSAKPDVVINFIGYELADVELDCAAFAGRAGQYIFISSTTVHARPAPLPITEDAPIGNAFWEYARKKAQCEAWLVERWRAVRFPVTIVRPSHTYSKRWIPNAVASSNHAFAARLKGGKPVFVHDDGENPWTMTAAPDFAAGLCGLFGLEASLGEAVHITSDEVLTWNRIYHEIAEAFGAPAPDIRRIPTELVCNAAPNLIGTLKGDKAHPGIFDNSKIKRLVPGFACKKNFRNGIRESVEWLEQDHARWKMDPATNALIESVLSECQRRNNFGSP